MSFRKGLLCIMVLFLSSCARTTNSGFMNEATHFQVPQDRAAIYLYRDRTFSSGVAGIVGTISHNNISIDNKHTLNLNNAEYYIVEVLPGNHSISWTTVLMGYETGPEQIQVSLKPGQWTQVNFSDTGKEQPISSSKIHHKLRTLDFIKRINLSDTPSDL